MYWRLPEHHQHSSIWHQYIVVVNSIFIRILLHKFVAYFICLLQGNPPVETSKPLGGLEHCAASKCTVSCELQQLEFLWLVALEKCKQYFGTLCIFEVFSSGAYPKFSI